MSFEDILPTNRVSREKVSSIHRRVAPLVHFVHEHYQQHTLDEYEFEEHIRSLKTLAECVSMSKAFMTTPSARCLLLALNSADTNIFPRALEMNAINR